MNNITNNIKYLPVTEIQRFCMHDGPGVRTVVFFKGCPLRCSWCHNPETQAVKQDILFDAKKCIFCGACASVCASNAHSIRDEHLFDRSLCDGCADCTAACPTHSLSPAMNLMSIDEILREIEKDRIFYRSNGGVTLSGGEPLIHADKGVYSLLSECKKRGISTAIETCGEFNTDALADIVSVTDLFLWDIKDTDPIRHKKFTGVSNSLILKNLYTADKLGALTRLRCILVNKVNTSPEHYKAIADIAATLDHCEGVELIEYHAYGGSKMLLLGKEDNGRTDWIIPSEAKEEAKSIIEGMGIRVF